MQKFASVQPILDYGTTRSWDGAGLAWSQMNPSPGKYDFSALDKFIAVNQARHIEMIYTFGRTPRWASSKPNAPTPYGPGQCAPPRDIRVWDAYVRTIATHAAGRIRYWELWNEPNDPEYYCGSVPQIIQLAQHAAKIIRSIDPSARILSPAVVNTGGPTWLSMFLRQGGNASVDIIAFHGYASAKPEDILKIVPRYRAVMREDGAGAKPLWDTESSWGGAGPEGIPDSAGQAAFVAESYLLHWSAGVARFVWFIYDGDPRWGQLWSPTKGASAAAVAYEQTYQWMAGATMTAPCSSDPRGVWTCKLSRPNGSSAEVLWTSTGSINLTLPSRLSQCADLEGATRPIEKHQLTVTAQPALVYSSGFLP